MSDDYRESSDFRGLARWFRVDSGSVRQLRTIISLALIGTGAIMVLVLYAFRRRIRPRFVPGRRR